MPNLKKMLTLEALSEALPSWLKRSTKPEYNADEIDSTLTTNQFVTASDKDNWNAKGTYSKPSGGIPKSDLSSIVQTSLEKADSALQSETDPTVPSWAKQTNKPAYTQDEVADGSTYKRVNQTEKDAWSGKQNALTTTQMQAVNSGITSAGVTQIGKNQSAVSLLEQMNGAKNLFNFDVWANNATVTNGGQKIVSGNSIKLLATGNGDIYTEYTEGRYPKEARIPVNAGDTLYMTWNYSSDDRLSGNVYIFGNASTSSMASQYATAQHLEYTVPSGVSFVTMRVGIGSNVTGKSGVWSNIQIISKAVHDAGFTDYQPYALPNYDLTQALAEEIDAGAKNILKFDITLLKALNTSGTWSGNSYTKNGVTFTYNDSTKTISTYGTSTSNNVIFYLMNFTPTLGKSFAISGCPSGGSSTGYRFCNMGDTWANDYGSSDTAVGDDTSKQMAIYINNSGTAVGTSSNPLTWKPMICTLADWKVSQMHVPYRPSWDTLAMGFWSFIIQNYTSTAANTFEYTGVSFNVPAKQAYEFIVQDQRINTDVIGIIVCDSNSSVTTGATIAENSETYTAPTNKVWVRQVSGMTAEHDASVTYYVWVKRAAAASGHIRLAYRRVY